MTEAIGPDTPVCVVAREAVADAMREVAKRLRGLRRKGVKSAQRVHRFRVATRRASASVRLFHDLIDPEEAERCRKALKRLRRAAGLVRVGDVHLDLLRSGLGGRVDAESDAVRRLIKSTKSQRRRDRRSLQEGLTKRTLRRVEELAKRTAGSVAGDTTNLSMRAARWMGPALPSLVDAVDRSVADRAEFHSARIEVKRFRYAVELLRPAYTAPAADAMLVWLADLQDRMGAVNDLDELVAMVAPEGEPLRDEFALLHRTLRAEGNGAYASFAEWWRTSGRSELTRVSRPMLMTAEAPGVAPLGPRARAERGLVASAGSSGGRRPS